MKIPTLTAPQKEAFEWLKRQGRWTVPEKHAAVKHLTKDFRALYNLGFAECRNINHTTLPLEYRAKSQQQIIEHFQKL